MWPGWKAKFLSSNAAGLAPARAQEILDEFLKEHPEWADERGFGSQEKPHGKDTQGEPIR